MHYPTRDEIEELSPDERLRLIGDVWASFEERPDDLPFAEEHRAILEERLAAYERNPSQTISWDEVRRRIRNKA